MERYPGDYFSWAGEIPDVIRPPVPPDECILESTNFTDLGERKIGKVRDIYTQDNTVILVATDRYSAFDRNLALIPYKGEIVTNISQFWFNQTWHIVPNHVREVPDPNVVVAQKCKVLPIEMIVRGYITGVTNTSLWHMYGIGKRDFGNFVLPDGLNKNQELPEPVITPTTKFEKHDRPLTPSEMIQESLVDQATWVKISQISLDLFNYGRRVSLERGLVLVDTKYEFGLSDEGEIILIDELHTPDSSRYWRAATYEERIRQGLEPENFDKEFLRLWFQNNCDPYNDQELPEAPTEMIEELSARYVTLYEQLTGQTFQPDLEIPILDRIKANLQPYRI